MAADSVGTDELIEAILQDRHVHLFGGDAVAIGGQARGAEQAGRTEARTQAEGLVERAVIGTVAVAVRSLFEVAAPVGRDAFGVAEVVGVEAFDETEAQCIELFGGFIHHLSIFM